MSPKELSPREEQIVELCVEGLTNEAIAHLLGISVGTVNTYWLRIKLKVGGQGRTDTVVRIIKEKAEKALRDANTERNSVVEVIAAKEQMVLEHRAALALLQLAMDQIKSTVWATDRDLRIHVLANGEFTSVHFGVPWEIGRTVYEIFDSNDPKDFPIECHLSALEGHECASRLGGKFHNMFLRCIPLLDEQDDVMGVISVLNIVAPDHE